MNLSDVLKKSVGIEQERKVYALELEQNLFRVFNDMKYFDEVDMQPFRIRCAKKGGLTCICNINDVSMDVEVGYTRPSENHHKAMFNFSELPDQTYLVARILNHMKCIDTGLKSHMKNGGSSYSERVLENV